MVKKRLDNNVSFVVPAYNAASTLDETLRSIKAQTFPDWEAIIIDDGSTDNTAIIAAGWTEHDRRFRLVRQANGGESAARNTGIREANNRWLVFLDSDDWIAPEYLERMLNQIEANPRLDAVVCGCVRVTPEGKHGRPAIYESESLVDPFPEFARDCPFAIHNCMVRHRLVDTVGEFDTSLDTCADWDFWQRMARVGIRFGTVPEVLAFYRMRPGSSSSRAQRVLLDGFNVIRRGHRADPRLTNPDPRYIHGRSGEGLSEALFRHALWPVSLMLSQGKDARTLLPLMGQERVLNLEAKQIAQSFFDCIPLAAAGTIEDWPALWPTVADRLQDFLAALARQSGTPELAQQSIRSLECLILEAKELKHLSSIGSTLALRLDVAQPIANVTPPAGLKQLDCIVEAEGAPLGSVQIPIMGPIVQGSTIAEAIVCELAWPLLRWYFQLGLPPGSPLQAKVYWLMQEPKPSKKAIGLVGLIWPIISWQFQEGLLRKPGLMVQLIWLVLTSSLSLLAGAIFSVSAPRESWSKRLIVQLAHKLMSRKSDLLVTSPAVEPAQSAAPHNLNV